MSETIEYQDQIRPGTVLDGRFEILGELGEGGFAMVYRARQLNIQRSVAIKVLNASSDSRSRAAFEERFLREARTAAQITHPNVVTIYDFGFTEAPRRPYIAMELLTGHDLESELQKHGPMAPERVLPLFVECLEALAEAHRRGIIHKDLKPSNLFLTSPGTRREAIKIVDFGIARIQDAGASTEGRRLTNTGQILGTPQYLAPEYIKNQTATPAVDVYQMGLILVELLTGRAVVDSDNPYQCLMVHGSGQLEVPEVLVKGTLGPVLLKALAFQHEERYPDAEAFRAALEAIEPGRVSAPAPQKRRITDVSGNLRTVAASGEASSTGGFEQRQSGDYGRDVAPARGGASPFAPTLEKMPSQELAAAPPAKLSLMVGAAAGLVLLLLGAVGVVGYLMLADEDKDAKPRARAELAALEAPPQAEAAPQAEAPPEAGAALAEALPAEVAPEPPSPVSLALRAEPAEAKIYQGDQELGQGGATLSFADGDAAPITVRVASPGFEEQTLTLSPKDGPEAVVALQPVNTAEARRLRAAEQRRKAQADKARGDQAPAAVGEPSKGAAEVKAAPPVEPPKETSDPKETRPTMGFVE